MSKNLESLIDRLETKLGKKKPTRGGRQDYKALKALEDKHVMKLKEGKNNIVIITPEGQEDPFTFLYYHLNLSSIAPWIRTYCPQGNADEECVVCNTIKSLQEDNYKGNMALWQPILQKIDYYVPAINVESAATIAEGPKWVKLSKTVTSVLTEWIKNLEEGEEPFYSDDEPQKLTITYTKGVAPAEQYKVDKKNYKAFDEQTLARFRSQIISLYDIYPSKSNEELKKLLDEYLVRIQESIDSTTEAGEDSPLGFLKK